MRVELALILGIICFCCWCAYILVKMNYSTATLSSSSQPLSPTLPSSSSPRPSPSVPVTSGQAQHQYQHQPAAAMTTSQVVPAPQHHHFQQPYHPYLYYHHNQSRWPKSSAHVNWAPRSNYRAATGESHRDMTEPEEAETSSDGGGGGSTEDDNPPPADETTEDTQEDEGNADDDGLERSRGARHHSEQEWSSNERDRLGRPVLARRRHFINGKPAHKHRAAAASELARQQPDFDQVVSEIDNTNGEESPEEENSEEEPPAQSGQQLEESRPVGTSVGANGLVVRKAPSSGDTRTKRPRDSHEHSLKETLSAQQWDDDSGAATATGQGGRGGERPKLKGADEEVESGGGDGQDLAELELFANSDKFPFGSAKRRRRSTKEEDLANAPMNLALEIVNGESTNTSLPDHAPSGDYYAPYAPPVVVSNGHSGGQALGGGGDWPLTSSFPYYSAGSYNQPFALGSGHGRRKQQHKPKRRKFKKSAMAQGKRREAEAHWIRKSSKHKKGGAKKRRKGSKKKMSKKSKEFKTETSGRKSKGGGGKHGVKKGALYLNDKGYKKRGFKKAYRRLEAGDHKTYFDEFRDKDHNKRWKEYRDKQGYGQSKNWRAKEARKYKNYKSKEASDKKMSQSGYKAKAGSRAHASKAKRAKGYSNKSHKLSD